MKTLLLPLLFLISVSFTGKTDQLINNKNQTTNYFCTNCWDHADSAENAAGGNDFDTWQDAYDNCLDNLDPCGAKMEPVTVELKK